MSRTYEADQTMAWLLASPFSPSEQIELRGARLYTVLRGLDAPCELGSVTFTTDDGWGHDWYTVALRPDGTVRWGRGSTESRANGLAVAADHVVRAGFDSTATGGGHAVRSYQLDAYDPSGDRVDGYDALDDHGVPRGTAVAEGGGAVYVAVRGTDDAGWVLQRYVDRALDWERELGAGVGVTDIAVDGHGRAYVAGHLTADATFDGATYGAEDDGFAVSFGTAGETRWSWFQPPPADALYTSMREIDVSDMGLVFIWHGYGFYSGARVVALRQP